MKRIGSVTVVESMDDLDTLLSSCPERVTVDKAHGAVYQMYYNPDAASGCQIVDNTYYDLDPDVLDRSPEEILQYLSESDAESEATQRLFDISMSSYPTGLGNLQSVSSYFKVAEFVGGHVLFKENLDRLKEEFESRLSALVARQSDHSLSGHSVNVGYLADGDLSYTES